jgi:alpha-L-fucosidase
MITLEGFTGKIKYAQLLHDASEIGMSTRRATIWLNEKSKGDEVILKLPVLKPNVEIPVIELIMN